MRKISSIFWPAIPLSLLSKRTRLELQLSRINAQLVPIVFDKEVMKRAILGLCDSCLGNPPCK